MKLNQSGNSYPSYQPIYKVLVLEDTRLFKKGDVIEVMESHNPWFTSHWRVTDSFFIHKDKCKLII